MDINILHTKKLWLEQQLNTIQTDLNDLTIKNHRFLGALGFVNDLIKELEGDGEPKKKGKPNAPRPTKTI
jgi:hypothetical protein